jgi:hypothetical protein
LAVDIYIEGQRLDTFGKEENIEVTTAVQDVKDISKIRGDYSQSFTVPASKRNNSIFKNYYNADVDGGFDARTRKTASIDVDTLDFKRGKIQLVDVAIKENQISHYKIVFYGNTIKVKDLIGEDKLKDLDWLDNFNHDYTAANVKTGLTTGLDFTVDSVTYNKAVCYPLISYARQYFYSSDPTDTTSTDSLVNIAYDAGRTDGIAFGELRPAIQVKIIIQAITEKYGLSFTGTFFDSTRFTELYVNVNNTKDSLSNGLKVYENVSGSYVGVGTRKKYEYYTTVTPKAGFTTVPYKIRLSINDSVVYESSVWLTGTKTKYGIADYTEDYTAKAEIITETDFEFDATTDFNFEVLIGADDDVFNNSYTSQVIDLDTIITTQFKDIKVYDFLTSIFKMFNLVVVPDGDDLYVEDLESWYAQGQIYDITQYIDTKEYKVSRGKILNQIDFKFKESKQILADFFNQENGFYFGNLENKLYTDETKTELLEGDKLDISVIFEQPIFERLNDTFTSSEINLLYGLMLNDELSPFVGEPFLMYLPSVSVASNPLGFKGTTYDQLSGNVLMPSHSIEHDTDSFNINFGAEINEFTSQVFLDTIYDRYFDDYISDIFSIKRRIYNYTAMLPNRLLTKIKANDRLVIDGRRYLINTIKSNIVNRKDSLELINDIYDAPLASDSLNSSLWSPVAATYSGNAGSGDSRYIGLATATLSLVDTGYGTSWITITGSVTGVINTITFDLDANATGALRTVQIKATDGVNDPKFTITQNAIPQGALNFANPDNSALMNTILIGKS